MIQNIKQVFKTKELYEYTEEGLYCKETGLCWEYNPIVEEVVALPKIVKKVLSDEFLEELKPISSITGKELKEKNNAYLIRKGLKAPILSPRNLLQDFYKLDARNPTPHEINMVQVAFQRIIPDKYYCNFHTTIKVTNEEMWCMLEKRNNILGVVILNEHGLITQGGDTFQKLKE